MKTWLVLFGKEWRESFRNFKWIWIPLVFILLGMMQPLTYYFLPDILKSIGSLPDGAVIQIPTPTGGQVLAETLGQFSQIGILILVLAYMGTVATERNHGTNIMVLVKPVPYVSYITAKWVHLSVVASVSLFLGTCFSYYYTYLLIDEHVSFVHTLQGTLIYALYLIFVMTLLLCFSTIFNSTAAVAFLTIGLMIVLSIINGLAPHLMRWSPSSLTSHSYSLLQNGHVGDYFLVAFISTIIIIILLILFTVYLFKNKEKAIQTM